MTIDQIKNIIEERLEEDYGVKHIILNMQHTPLLKEVNNLEFVRYQSSDKQQQIIVTVRLEDLEHQFLASWREALLLPSLLEKGKRGQTIKATDIIYTKVVVNTGMQSYISDSNALIGKALKRDIMARNPLKNSDLATPIMIEKGDRVTIRYQKKSLTIESSCVALENGSEGEVIKLKNLDSNKVLHGKVISKDLVCSL